MSMKRDMKAFRKKANEYMEFVKKNYRYPNKTDKFDDGTLINSWRAYALRVVKDKEIIQFEDEWRQKILTHRKEKSLNSKNQYEYDKMTGSREDGDPQTLDEYLKGNNRFMYFSTETYIKIMDYIGDASPLVSHLRLLTRIDGSMGWDYFHHHYCLDTLVDQMDHIINNLKSERERNVLIDRFGLDGNKPKTLEVCGKKYGVCRNRIRDIEYVGIRNLRHPMFHRKMRREAALLLDESLPKLSRLSKQKAIGPYIAVYCNNYYKHGGTVLTHVVQAESYLIEETLDQIGYDVDSIDAEWQIKSVDDHIDPQEWVPDDIFSKINLPIETIMCHNTIDYTVVHLERVIKKTTEDYVNEYREYLKQEALQKEIDETRRAERKQQKLSEERNKKAKLEESSRQCATRMNTQVDAIKRSLKEFYYAFSSRVIDILDSIYLDDNYKWLQSFNKKIDGFTISRFHTSEASNIMKEQLSARLEQFSVTCVFRKFENSEDYYTLVLRENKK